MHTLVFYWRYMRTIAGKVYYSDLAVRSSKLPVDPFDVSIDGDQLMAVTADPWVNPSSGGEILNETQYAEEIGVVRETVIRYRRRGWIEQAGVHDIGVKFAPCFITNTNSIAAQKNLFALWGRQAQKATQFKRPEHYTSVSGASLINT